MTKSKPELVKPEPQIKEPDISHLVSQYAEFHTAYDVGMTKDTQHLYSKLIEEEHEEWVEEYFGANVKEYNELKELVDLVYVTLGLAHTLGYKLTKATTYQIKEYYDYSITDLVTEISTGARDKRTLSGLIYCVYGYCNAMGWDLDEAFKRVHESNMSKLGDDGKPIRREDGKILKGPNYKPPSLEDLTNGM